MPRLFIAASLPAPTRLQIETAVGPLRSSLPAASWIRAEALHLTFAFLGDQDEALAGPLGLELESRLSELESFEIVVARCGFFPNERRPRVAWVGLEPPELLEEIAKRVRGALRARRVSFDEKPFSPHLTLARLRQRWRRRDIELFTQALGEFHSTPAQFGEVVLFQSQLSPKGAIHTPLRRVRLRAPN